MSSTSQSDRLRRAAEAALTWLEGCGAPLPAAMVSHAWFGGSSHDVVAALGPYQNDDGGLGHGLEVDIAAPASNPFATRLGLIALRPLAPAVRAPLATRIGEWLSATQSDDGDWRFSEATRADRLAPWFEHWTFPSLNPACCLAGQAAALEVATPQVLDRVAELFEAQASLEQAGTGEFYDLLPYVEYSLTGALPADYLAAVAATITRQAERGGYEDADHLFGHVLGGTPELTERIPAAILHEGVERALDEQQPDGGWPTPYDQAWRPWVTASLLTQLARLC